MVRGGSEQGDEFQLTLLDLATISAHRERVPRRELRVKEVSRWAARVARKLARTAGLEGRADSFLLAQTIKLGEEVGELYAEVLGAARLQRESKGDRYSTETLRGELADVTICVAIIAELVGVNLEEALVEKMAVIDERMRDKNRSTG